MIEEKLGLHKTPLIKNSCLANDYNEELAQVKASPAYRIIQSKPYEKSHTQFTYHFAEQKKWRLGSGSYGEVYCCYFEEIMTKRVHKFALKRIIIPNSIEEVKRIEDTVATTRQQIKSMIKLKSNHNIIKLQDVIGDREHNRIYMILEYCNNKDLQSFFRKQRQRGLLKTQEQILFYFKQLLHAFEDLYKYNIIHRDIKPANIFVHNNIVKIGDFGLSQQLFERREKLHDHKIIGTLCTSAPQLIFKEKYTNKCDIYSLGLTLYWMLYQKFPYQNIDAFDKDQLLKQSLSFDTDSPVKISSELAQLLKLMLAFEESDRIDWMQLFSHPIFDRIVIEDIPVRQTIGRNIQNQNLSMMLESTIPAEFYLYIGENDDMEELLEGQTMETPIGRAFMKIWLEGLNFSFKLNFLKMLLREVFDLSHSDKIKNKIEFSIIKDLLRRAIDMYIVYLNQAFLDQLNGFNRLHILDLKMLNEISCSKYFQSYVEKRSLEVEAYYTSQKKPKLSKGELEALQVNCRKYDIGDKFHLILGRELLVKDQVAFLEELKQCIVQLMFFMKEEVRYYSKQEENLPQSQFQRYRQEVLLIHHMNMLILLPKIFPQHYDPNINYDHQKFNAREKYPNRHLFFKLARQVVEIIARFQN